MKQNHFLPSPDSPIPNPPSDPSLNVSDHRSSHRIRLPHACRRVYFHSRLEIAGHWSNIIIAMTGVARARASERASAVESRTVARRWTVSLRVTRVRRNGNGTG